ncbi:NAD(P)-dependent alcohol dehydrogenase [Pseudarthrobacter sp. P1]|uniref:NAD(P)-dependent alcohol dehydrogenase n=1 Tax=Pseudarthrobacter sp. P1 TaxID=3418418 RepID=UPI003CE75ABE
MAGAGKHEVWNGNSASLGAEGGQMLATVRDRYGDADVLHQARIERPLVKDNEVLVRVHAAGLDRGTWHLMTGRPYVMRLFLGLRRPRNPVSGLDLAGTVAAVGRSVTRFKVGEEVFGFGNGSFAEYATAREDKLALKPAGLTFEEAAVVPVSAVTALQGLRDAGRVQAGQKVLVTGASGGVGSYAVQLAKAFGADVTGVSSTSKMDLVRSLGADYVIDYSREDFAAGSRHYDLILDFAGNPALSRLRRALTATGTAVVGGGEHGGNVTGMGRQLRALALSPFVSQRLAMFAARQRAVDLEEIAGLIDAGKVTPCLDRTFPLEQAEEAMRYLVAGKARGKVAITVWAPQ